MKVQKYCIYNLSFFYTRISTKGQEIDFRGILNYHVKDIELLKAATSGILDQDAVNVFLFFQVQRNIDVIIGDVNEDDIVKERPILINRLKMVMRRELEDIGLELVDFKQISLWAYGAAAHGVTL
ncbi:MAG: hypothetical protein EAX86_13415 [Candidatus Heimdallarchaeota archaeon]|nr:hypothetical protein [Candidatus Heimdallarchaeota archaeon]